MPGNIAFTGSFAVFGTGRCYDQIRNTVAYANLDVKIAPTHAGISVGPDGGSHQMLEDISLMCGLPPMKVLVPADYASACAALRLAAETPGPVYVRMGRASVPPSMRPMSSLSLARRMSSTRAPMSRSSLAVLRSPKRERQQRSSLKRESLLRLSTHFR